MPQQAPDFIPSASATQQPQAPPDFIPAAPQSATQSAPPDFIPAATSQPKQVPSTSQPYIDKAKEFLNKPLFNPLDQPQFEPLKAAFDYLTKQAAQSQSPAVVATGKVASGAASGVADVAKSFTSPLNLALAVGTGGLGEAAPIVSRLLSAGFSIESLASAWNNIPAIRDAIHNGDIEGATRLLTGEAANLGVAGLTGAHAALGTSAAVAPDSHPATVEGGLPEGMMEELTKPINVDHQIMSIAADNEQLRASLRSNAGTPEERAAATQRIAQNLEIMKDLQLKPLDQAVGHALGHSNIGEINDLIASGELANEPSQDEFRRSLELGTGASGSQSAEENIHALEGGDTRGESIDATGEPDALTAAPSGAGEEDIRGDRGVAGREGTVAADDVSGAEQEAAGGVSADRSVGQSWLDKMEADRRAGATAGLAPEWMMDARGKWFTPNAMNAESYAGNGGHIYYVDVPMDVAKITKEGTHFTPEHVLPEVWSNKAKPLYTVPDKLVPDKEPPLADGYVRLYRGMSNDENLSRLDIATLGPVAMLHEALTDRPLDINNLAGERGDGSVMTRQPAISPPVDRDLANGGITVMRPGKDLGLIPRYLGSLTQQAARMDNPFFKSIANKIADTTIALARNGRDAIQTFRAGTRSIVSPDEWAKQVVPLLNNPEVSPDTLDPTLPSNIKQAYLNERARLDRDRLDIIRAKRQALVNSGMTRNSAIAAVPDDWGIKQGYYHHAFPGNWTIMLKSGDGYEPIDTGWRQITFDLAHDKAKEYLAANPDAQLKVQLDSATMPGSNFTDKNRLLNLMESVKAASELVYNGENPDGVLRSLTEEAQAAAYGPRRPAQRQNPAILQREANLPGWATDIDNYERYIMGIERYKELAPARQELLATRNKLAQTTGMAPIQRITEMPARYSGQFANMLGRADASIEALEGYPTGFDAAIRNRLQQLGYDPNMVDRAYSYINSAEALLKLGFNPASSGLHMAQTLAATYPVLGEKYTLSGLLNSYSPKYADLVHDLGIQANSNLMDIDTFNAYKGGYFSGTGLGSKLGGAYHILQDTGLFMFSKGVETARRIAAIGAYQKALDMGMDSGAARNYARDQLIRTQFLYSPADAPIALRQLPRPLTQFRNFTLKMMEFTTGLRGAEIPRFLLAMGMIGYVGLPALTALSSMMEYTTGYNPEDEMKKFLPRASRGVLGMLGIDYTNNIGFADWFGSRALDPDRMLGPAGSDILNLAKAGIAELKGPSRQGQQDINTAMRNVSPEVRRIWDEATRMTTGGNLTDPRSGSIIIKKLSPGERLELLSGLTPIRVAEERDAHDRIVKEIDQSKDKRGYFVDSIANLQLEMMRSDLNMQQHLQLVQQVANLAKLAQDYGVGNKLPEAVRDRARQMLSERLMRDVKGAPRSVRPDAYQELQQFNQQQDSQ